jgi:UDP-N-acetylmuramate: L-alanyl-gamma-D-glutamyl-meso-diaminopimelate ligase
MHIHILGICGTFMGGLAVLAREAGHTVTGCDAGVYPPMSTQLEAQGITLIEGYGAEQIDLKPDLFVIGNVVTRGNPLMEAILDRGLPTCPARNGSANTCCRQMGARGGGHARQDDHLVDAGVDAGRRRPESGLPDRRRAAELRRVGAADRFELLRDRGRRVRHGVLRQALEVRPLPPRTAVLNNLEYDHADIFPDLAAIETQFHHLVRTVPGGRIVRTAERRAERVLARGCWSEVERFGVDGGWQALPAEDGVPVDERFAVYSQAQRVGEVAWQVQGEHNRMNALAAIAAARHVGVPPAQAAASLHRSVT